jgi:hypothetical protein
VSRVPSIIVDRTASIHRRDGLRRSRQAPSRTPHDNRDRRVRRSNRGKLHRESNGRVHLQQDWLQPSFLLKQSSSRARLLRHVRHASESDAQRYNPKKGRPRMTERRRLPASSRALARFRAPPRRPKTTQPIALRTVSRDRRTHALGRVLFKPI